MSPFDEKKASEMLKRIFDESFTDTPSSKPKPTDEPNIKLFMLQIVKHYARLASADPMTWEKTFRNKDNGKEYTVAITLREMP